MSVKRVEVVERSQIDTLSLPLLSCESWMFVKENPDRKEKLSAKSVCTFCFIYWPFHFKSNLFNKNKKITNTFQRNKHKFFKPLFQVLFEYIYWSWLFHLYYISVKFTKHGSAWQRKGNKRLTVCWIKNKSHRINLWRRQWELPKNYNYLNPT